MNKKLLTLAVGAALAATSGFAAADVSWYGKGDIKLLGGDTVNDTLDMAGEGSRIGIRASEDIGNGLEVKFWHEWAINPADGTSPTSNDAGGQGHVQFGHRDSLLSFHGGFGMFGVGSLAAPTKVIGAGKIDGLFADTVGDLNARGIKQPAGQQILYGYKFDSVSFAVAYGVENQTADADWVDGNIQWNAGAFYIGAGIHSSGDTYIASFNGGTLMNVAASYTMDNFKILAGYQAVSDYDADNSGIDGSAMSIGGSFSVGNGAILAQYNTDDTDDDRSGDTMSVGYNHNLSKAVQVGVHYSTYDPEDNTDSTDLYDLRTTISF